jgi:hypothetical protein
MKQYRTVLRDQVANDRPPEKRAGIYTELKSHALAEYGAKRELLFYTPLYPVDHGTVWNIRTNLSGCPTNIPCANQIG